MNRLQRIEAILKEEGPDYLEIIDESAYHKGHREASDGEFTHVKIIISDIYPSLSLLQKHRRIKSLLSSEFDTGMHAISISLIK